MKRIKKIIAILLVAVMVVGALPLTTFADEKIECEKCGEEIFGDWVCSNHSHCGESADNECFGDNHCPNCGGCLEDADQFCPECLICSSCSSEEFCSQQHVDCVYCHEDILKCPGCGGCRAEAGLWCDKCDLCQDCCGDLCEAASFHDNVLICADCHEPGKECCTDCNTCYTQLVNFCLSCGRCDECTEFCDNLGDHADTICYDCHDAEDICIECEVCKLNDDSECGHCEECAEYYLCEQCGECYECKEVDYCDSCGMCYDCVGAEDTHCELCEGCMTDIGQCEDGEDHCLECCVVCEGCEMCILNTGDTLCPDCYCCTECCNSAKEQAGCDCLDPEFVPCVNDINFELHMETEHSDFIDNHIHTWLDWESLENKDGVSVRECTDCDMKQYCSHDSDTLIWEESDNEDVHKYDCPECGLCIEKQHNLYQNSSGVFVCSDCGYEPGRIISNVSVVGVNAPVEGMVSDYSYILRNSRLFSVTSVYWEKCTTEPTGSARPFGTTIHKENNPITFTDGNYYIFTILLKPVPGYKFDDKVFATINGRSAWSAMTGSGNIMISLLMNLKSNTPIDFIEIIRVKEPQIGKKISYNCTVQPGHSYSLSNWLEPTWFITKKMPQNFDDVRYANENYSRFDYFARQYKYKAGEYYTIVVPIAPDKGYKITENTIAYINGERANVYIDNVGLFGNNPGEAYVYYTFPIPKVISAVSIRGVQKPTIGVTPKQLKIVDGTWIYGGTVEDDAPYTLSYGGGIWHETATDQLNGYSEEKRAFLFGAGRYYYICYFLRAKDGYTFDSSNNITLSTNVNWRAKRIYGDEKLIEVKIFFERLGDIHSVAISNVTKPVVAARPSYTSSVASGEKYSVSGCLWFESNFIPDSLGVIDCLDPMPSTEIFKTYKYYSVRFELTAKTNYHFAKNAKARLFGEYTWVDVSSDGEKMWVYATFSPSSFGLPISYGKITGIDVPVAGKTADYSPYIDPNENYVVSKVEWAESDTKLESLTDINVSPLYGSAYKVQFTGGKYYGIRLKLTAKNGYAFNKYVQFTVNGENAWVDRTSETVAWVYVAFDSVLIKKIKLNGLEVPEIGKQATFDFNIPANSGFSKANNCPAYWNVFDTFPNNIYNDVVNCKEYYSEYGELPLYYNDEEFYVFECRLVADVGCKFDENVAVTINNFKSHSIYVKFYSGKNYIDVYRVFNKLSFDDYKLNIDGKNYYHVKNGFSSELPSGITWDDERLTLTLNNFKGKNIYCLQKFAPLNIHLKGKNELCNFDDGETVCLSTINGDINITADTGATLYMLAAGDSAITVNIQNSIGSKFNIKSGTIEINASPEGVDRDGLINHSYGIKASEVNITGDAELEIWAIDDDFHGTKADVKAVFGNINISTSGNVIIDAPNIDSDEWAVYGVATINGTGTVEILSLRTPCSKPIVYDANLYTVSPGQYSHFLRHSVYSYTGPKITIVHKTFGKKTDTIVQLISEGTTEPAYEFYQTGTLSDNAYIGSDYFAHVPAGTYTVRVIKENHVTREYSITVGNSSKSLKTEINLIGDIDNNGKINNRDISALIKHLDGSELITDGYKLLCANTDNNNKINNRDSSSLIKHLDGSHLLF